MIALLNCVNHKKHLGVILDKHLNFHEHIEGKLKICNKLFGTIKRLSVHLPRSSLLSCTLIMVI